MDDDKYTDKDLSQVAQDLKTLQDADIDTSDAGKRDVSPKTVSGMTGDSSRQAAHAEHVFHDDAEEAGDMGIPENRHDK